MDCGRRGTSARGLPEGRRSARCSTSRDQDGGRPELRAYRSRSLASLEGIVGVEVLVGRRGDFGSVAVVRRLRRGTPSDRKVVVIVWVIGSRGSRLVMMVESGIVGMHMPCGTFLRCHVDVSRSGIPVVVELNRDSRGQHPREQKDAQEAAPEPRPRDLRGCVDAHDRGRVPLAIRRCPDDPFRPLAGVRCRC